MFLSCSGQAFTEKDSEDEDEWSEMPSHHLPFPWQWELQPLQLPSKKGAQCTCCLWQLSPGRPWSFISSSCLNPRYHIPYSSMPVASTSQRHSLTSRVAQLLCPGRGPCCALPPSLAYAHCSPAGSCSYTCTNSLSMCMVLWIHVVSHIHSSNMHSFEYSCTA